MTSMPHVSLERWQSLNAARREAVLALHIPPAQLEFAGSIERAVAACEAAAPEEVAGLAILASGAVAGFVVLSRGARRPDWAPPRSVALTAMRIDERQQGRGLGKAALAQAEAWLRIHWPDEDTLALSVDEENHAGRRAYAAAGYTEHTASRPGRIGMVRYLAKALGPGPAPSRSPVGTAEPAPHGGSVQIPTLETERLRLVPPSVACWPAYERFYTDPAASGAYGGPLATGAAWARLSADLGSWHLQGFGVWAIARRCENDIVGTCGFWQGRGWPRELTWWLLPAARRLGLAREASVAAIGHAYRVFGWTQVQTYMNDENAAARALAQALGGVQVARQQFPDGRERDVFRLPPP